MFSVGDEFLLHCFEGHLLACICTPLGVDSLQAEIQHQHTEEWLKSTADSIVASNITPTTSDDPAYALYRSYMHLSFLYADLRDAIRFEDGMQIIRQ